MCMPMVVCNFKLCFAFDILYFICILFILEEIIWYCYSINNIITLINISIRPIKLFKKVMLLPININIIIVFYINLNNLVQSPFRDLICLSYNSMQCM